MKILNDYKGVPDGTVMLSKWEIDLICEGLISIIGDIPEEHPDLDVAAKLHVQMNALYDLLGQQEATEASNNER
jgi:hypothetical protein